MFKILVIQAQNGLSDDKAEFLINDRLSFMRFLGLGLGDRVPDAKTIWMFRERLTRAGAIDDLFRRFDAAICAAGYVAMSGQIVDSSLVAAPKQRNTRDEKQATGCRMPRRSGMFRERLTRAGAIDDLFRRFDAAICAAGYVAMSGQIVDSSLVAAPKQRNTRDEKQAIRAGKTAPEIWELRSTMHGEVLVAGIGRFAPCLQ